MFKKTIKKAISLSLALVIGFSPISPLSITNNQKETVEAATYFKKYNLTKDQLLQLASLCQQEQGSPKGAAAEASLMANRFELYKARIARYGYTDKYGSGAKGLVNYVRKSGWFYRADYYMKKRNANARVVAAVRDVLYKGRRILPKHVDEHDCIGDITKAYTANKKINKYNRKSYKRNSTTIYNRYGSSYRFYSFPTAYSDPFGSTSEARRLVGSSTQCYTYVASY